MKKNIIILILFALAADVFAQTNKRPNIILVMADDQGS